MSIVAADLSTRASTGVFDRIRISAAARGWATLLLVLAACLPPLVVDLRERMPTSMENFAVVSARETWERQRAGDGRAWLMPTLNGEPRIVKPPLVVWLNLLAWFDLDPATCSTADLTERARGVAIGHGVLMLAGVFWLGLTLGDLRLAVLAALFTGSTVFFVRQARTASYDIVLAAWSTHAIAAALAAMRPLGPPRSAIARVACWLAAALALGMAWLAKGPVALAVVGLPVAAAIVLMPSERFINALFVAGCALAGSLPALLWHAYVWRTLPDASRRLASDYARVLNENYPFCYYLNLLALALPWTLWLLVGVVLPFNAIDSGRRRVVLVPWCWLALLFVFFSIPAYKAQRYMVPVLPAVALLAGQAWLEYGARRRDGTLSRLMKIVQRLHDCGVAGAPILFGLYLLAQNCLIARGWLKQTMLHVAAWPQGVLAFAAMLGLAVVACRSSFAVQPVRAAVAAALMAVMACMLSQRAGESREPRVLELEAARVIDRVGAAPLRYLATGSAARRPSVEFLLHSRRVVPPVAPSELSGYRATAPRVFVMASSDEASDALLADAGFTAVLDLFDSRRWNRRLWQRDSPTDPERDSVASELFRP